MCVAFLLAEVITDGMEEKSMFSAKLVATECGRSETPMRVLCMVPAIPVKGTFRSITCHVLHLHLPNLKWICLYVTEPFSPEPVFNTQKERIKFA